MRTFLFASLDPLKSTSTDVSMNFQRSIEKPKLDRTSVNQTIRSKFCTEKPVEDRFLSRDKKNGRVLQAAQRKDGCKSLKGGSSPPWRWQQWDSIKSPQKQASRCSGHAREFETGALQSVRKSPTSRDDNSGRPPLFCFFQFDNLKKKKKASKRASEEVHNREPVFRAHAHRKLRSWGRSDYAGGRARGHQKPFFRSTRKNGYPEANPGYWPRSNPISLMTKIEPPRGDKERNTARMIVKRRRVRARLISSGRLKRWRQSSLLPDIRAVVLSETPLLSGYYGESVIRWWEVPRLTEEARDSNLRTLENLTLLLTVRGHRVIWIYFTDGSCTVYLWINQPARGCIFFLYPGIFISARASKLRAR